MAPALGGVKRGEGSTGIGCPGAHMKPTRIALAALFLFCVSCTGAEEPSSTVGRPPQSKSQTAKRLVAAIQGNPRMLNNRVDAAGAGGTPGVDNLEELVHAGLVSADRSGRLQAQLAEAVPTIENGLWQLFPDGTMETTWRIRPGAAWHDGVPLSAWDLWFTQDVSQDRELPMFADSANAYIDEIVVPDPSTIVVRWRGPYIEADALWSRLPTHLLPLPQHILGDAYEAGENFSDLPYWTDQFVGLGPFVVEDFQRGSHILLRANDAYVLGRAKLDEIEVRFFEDANSVVAGMLSGQVQASLGRGLSLDQALQLRNQWRDGQIVFSYINWQAMYPQYLDPNPSIIADTRFRRGLLELTDRQSIVDTLMAGLVPVAHVYLSPQDQAYGDIASSVVRYDYDPTKAAQDFLEAGAMRGPDGGFRDFKGDLIPSLEIRTTAQLDTQPKTMLAVADYWQRAGLAVETVVVPSQRVSDREYRATMPGFELARQPNDTNALLRLHSSQVPLPENGFTGANRARYRGAILDALIERYAVTIPREDRLDALKLVIRHMTDQAIWLGLFYEIDPSLVSNRVKQLGGRGMTATQSWNATQWDID
jgi:ABC-type transport system substrate-binding protein